MSDVLSVYNTQNDLSMPCKDILHAQYCSKVTVTARNTDGQGTFKCPEPVPEGAATSHISNISNTAMVTNTYAFKISKRLAS
eukprot:6201554-Pleurochrysis_carterae.AAC.1